MLGNDSVLISFVYVIIIHNLDVYLIFGYRCCVFWICLAILYNHKNWCVGPCLLFMLRLDRLKSVGSTSFVCRDSYGFFFDITL